VGHCHHLKNAGQAQILFTPATKSHPELFTMLFRVALIVALLGVALCEDSPASKVLNQFRARNKAALVAHVDEGKL